MATSTKIDVVKNNARQTISNHVGYKSSQKEKRITMKYEIKNRFTDVVQFTAEIDCQEDAIAAVKVGLSVIWAVETGANLRDANLLDADLQHANLQGADLHGANLRDANLSIFI